MVVGGETNPLWLTTDLWYTVSASIDEWRPGGEVCRERKLQPATTSEDVTCADGTCELPLPDELEVEDKTSGNA